jgi:hypothetical protein
VLLRTLGYYLTFVHLCVAISTGMCNCGPQEREGVRGGSTFTIHKN